MASPGGLGNTSSCDMRAMHLYCVRTACPSLSPMRTGPKAILPKGPAALPPETHPYGILPTFPAAQFERPAMIIRVHTTPLPVLDTIIARINVLNARASKTMRQVETALGAKSTAP